MKRTYKKILSLILCILMIVPAFSMINASAAPAKVTGLRVDSVTSSTQKLVWSKASGASGYYVYKKTSSGYSKIATTSSTAYTVKNLSNGTKYTYKVKSYKGSSVSDYSSAVSAFTIGKTSKITVSSTGTTTITLSWSSVSKATGYAVYMLKGGTYSKIATVTGKTTYKVSGLSAGNDYSFIVVAFKKDSSTTTYGADSSIKKLSTSPATVKGLNGTVGSGYVTLNWNKISNATGYQVYRYDSSKKAYVLVAATQSYSYKVTGLSSSSEYKFKVRAFCSRYNTTYGAYSTVLTVNTLPSGTVISSDSSSSNSVTIRWEAVSGATGYEVWELNNKQYNRISKTKNTQYTLTGLSAGNKVTFKVRSYKTDSKGTYYGEYSQPYTVSTQPDAPTSVKAFTYNDNSVGVSWIGTENASGYKIYRKTSTEANYQSLGTVTSTSYIDSSVTSGVTYSYKVQSFITGTKNVYYSNYSNVATYTFEKVQKSSSTIKDKGVLGYLYNSKGKYFYTANDPWQRSLGFTSLYDTFSPTSYMWYVTERIRFSYNNLDWMIQVWKGQYGYAFIGAEVGVYTKEKTRDVLFYDCASDENRLKMTFDYYTRLNALFPYTKKFTTTYDYYWWCTGFIPGNKMFDMDRSNMRMDVRITLKDYTMLNAFCTALENLESQSTYPFYQEKYKKSNTASQSTYRVDGLDVYFSY